MLSFSLLPTFPALCQVLLRSDPAYAYTAVFFAFIAIILGTLSPIRHATLTPTLAELYARATEESTRQVITLIYRAQESYNQGIFCVYGTT